jgi:hypothetical protein
MFDWLNSVIDNWQFGVLLLSLLPPIAGFAHMIYFIYIVPDDAEDGAVLGGANDDGLGATAMKGGGVPEPARTGKKKHRRKHA